MAEKSFWHGGRRGITVGQFIRAPRERRREWSALERQQEAHYARHGYDSDRDPKRVYFTTDRELARGWAMNDMLALEGGGALYRVKPMPPSSLEPDPDYAATGFSARRAVVLEVAEDPVQMDAEAATRAVCAKYSLWTDGGRMYDDEGYMQPPATHRQGGATPELYRHLGRWFLMPPGHSLVFLDGQIFLAPTSSAS